jgi:hypothetical protein
VVTGDPYRGSRSEDASGFRAVVAELMAMHDSKQRDYGTDADPWANLRAGEPYGIPAWVHASTLVDHKSHRIQSFVVKGRLENEGVRDSLVDRAVYAVAALALYDEGEPPTPASQSRARAQAPHPHQEG